jgi:hypothetical protein
MAGHPLRPSIFRSDSRFLALVVTLRGCDGEGRLPIFTPRSLSLLFHFPHLLKPQDISEWILAQRISPLSDKRFPYSSMHSFGFNVFRGFVNTLPAFFVAERFVLLIFGPRD